jgi:hypothetical protein
MRAQENEKALKFKVILLLGAHVDYIRPNFGA